MEENAILSFQLHYEREDIKKALDALNRLSKRSRNRFFQLAILGVLFLNYFISIFLFEEKTKNIVFCLVIVLLIGMVCYLQFFHNKVQAEKQFNPTASYSFQFYETYFLYGSRNIPYDSTVQCVENEDAYLFIPQRRDEVLLLPKRSMTKEEKQTLSELLEQKLSARYEKPKE